MTSRLGTGKWLTLFYSVVTLGGHQSSRNGVLYCHRCALRLHFLQKVNVQIVLQLSRTVLNLLCVSIIIQHRKKKVREFPVPSRDLTTKLSLGRKNYVITELFLPRGSLVSDIPAGDGKLVNLFYGELTSIRIFILSVMSLEVI